MHQKVPVHGRCCCVGTAFLRQSVINIQCIQLAAGLKMTHEQVNPGHTNAMMVQNNNQNQDEQTYATNWVRALMSTVAAHLQVTW